MTCVSAFGSADGTGGVAAKQTKPRTHTQNRVVTFRMLAALEMKFEKIAKTVRAQLNSRGVIPSEAVRQAERGISRKSDVFKEKAVGAPRLAAFARRGCRRCKCRYFGGIGSILSTRLTVSRITVPTICKLLA